jgi:hypothetical protein
MKIIEILNNLIPPGMIAQIAMNEKNIFFSMLIILIIDNFISLICIEFFVHRCKI